MFSRPPKTNFSDFCTKIKGTKSDFCFASTRSSAVTSLKIRWQHTDTLDSSFDISFLKAQECHFFEG